jgi:hypothetical protein
MKLEEYLNKAGKFFVIGLDVVTSFSCYYCGYNEEWDLACFPDHWHITKDGESQADVICCRDCSAKTHNFLSI